MFTIKASALLYALVVVEPAAAQASDKSREIRRVYGSRLDQKSVPEVARGVVHRLDTRINMRLGNRLQTRVERYTTTADPQSSLRIQTQNDGSRRGVMAQDPLPEPDQ